MSILTKSGALSIAGIGNAAQRENLQKGAARDENIAAVSKAQDEREYDNGGFVGGIGYLGEKIGLGALSWMEGAWDFVAGGVAKLFGADDWAEEQIANDWVNYNHADEWFNPSSGWKIAGDVAQGIGNSLPSIAIHTAAAIATGGLSLGASAALTFGTSAISAAGQGVKEAYRKTGELGGKEWAFGALSGVLEGAVEAGSDLLGIGTGFIRQKISGTVAKTATRTGFLSAIGKSFAGEAAEEMISEFFTPYLARATYDPEAEGASVGDIIYAGVVGGLSGALMGGFSEGVSRVSNAKLGTKIAQSDADVLNTIDIAERISEKMQSSDKDVQKSYEKLGDTAKKLRTALETTGGKVKTFSQRVMLGELSRASSGVVLSQSVMRTAGDIAANAEAYADMYGSLFVDSKTGERVGITAEELTAGIDTTSPESISRSLDQAIRSNAKLRQVAVMQTAGYFTLDADAFADSIMNGSASSRMITQDAISQFNETATDAQKKAVAEALGMQVEELDAATPSSLGARMDKFMESTGSEAFSQRGARIKTALSLDESGANDLPTSARVIPEGATRYSEGGVDIAVFREGDKYSIYDYNGERGRQMSREMDLAALQGILREAKRAAGENEISAKSESRAVIKILSENISEIPSETVFDISENGVVEGKKSEYINDIFTEQGGYAVNPEIGRVELSKSGAKSTIFHGYGESKLLSAPAIKSVIEKGKIIHIEHDYKNSGKDRYIIAGKGKINNSEVFMGVVLKADTDTNGTKRFYLHEVIAKEATSPIMTATQKANTVSEIASKNSIPEKGKSVKGSSKKISTNKDATGPKTIAEMVEAGKSRQREAAIESFAEENVKGYGELGDVAKRAVRTTIRQARALGINEAAIKHAANVAARSGVNVLFDKEALKLNTVSDEGERYALVGKTEDGRSIYKTNYPKGTPASEKRDQLISLVQNIWADQPIELEIIENGKARKISVSFDPELSSGSDLSKIAFGNKKGNASEKRITLNLSSDFYQIAENSQYVGSKKGTGKNTLAHKDVTDWHYFITNLVYEENDTRIDCHMSIDVKEKADGNYFYSFAIEKGTAPQTLLAVVTNDAATAPIDSISQNSDLSTGNSKENLDNAKALKLAAAEKYADGAYLNGNIYINPELSEARTVDAVLMHELAHALTGQTSARAYASIRRDIFGTLKATDKEAVKYNGLMLKEAWDHTTAETKQAIAEQYGISEVNLNDMASNDSVLLDEIWAHFAEKMYGDSGVWEYFLGEDKNISKDAVAYWYEAARDYMGDETMARHARGFARKFKKMFEKIAEKNAGSNGAAMMGARVGDDDKEIKRALTIELGDVKNIRIIAAAHGGERVSINDFTSEDIQKAEKWARKFYSELGTKSPFFRAWFGDWRAYDTTKINTVTVDTIDIADVVMQNGNYEIDDTGWTVYAGRTLNKETAHYAGREKISVKALTAVKDILKNAVLLDTEISNPNSKNKSPNTAFMHKLYAPFIYDGQAYVAKIAVEEFYNEGTKNADRKAYHLQGIKIESAGGRFAVNTVLTPMPGTDSINSISDLFKLVKTYDKEFHPKEVNAALLNEDGTPKVVYHGTASDFWAFDIRKSNDKAGRLMGLGAGKGKIYLTEYEAGARAAASGAAARTRGGSERVMPLYVSAKKVMERAEYNELLKSAYEKYPGSNPREEGYDYTQRDKAIRDIDRQIQKQGYDAVFDKESGELFVFNPTQIKSATDNIGTFDGGNPDIRYARKKKLSDEDRAKIDEQLKEAVSRGESVNLRVSEMSKVQREKLIADATKPFVYSKATVKEVTDNICAEHFSGVFGDAYVDYQMKVSGRAKYEFYNYLAEKMNGAKAGTRKDVALEAADFILERVALREILSSNEGFTEELERATRIISFMRGYKNGFALDGIKGEINHKFGAKNGVNMRWGSADGVAVDVAARAFMEETGERLISENEADLFFEMLDKYDNARKVLSTEAREAMLADFNGEAGVEEIRQKVKEDVMAAFDKNDPSSLQKSFDTRLEERMTNETRKNKIRNSIAKRITEIKNHKIVSADKNVDAMFSEWIKDLSKLEWRGGLRSSGMTVRKIISKISEFYNTKNGLLYSEDEGLNYIDTTVVDAIELIKSGLYENETEANARKDNKRRADTSENAETRYFSNADLSLEELQAVDVIVGAMSNLFKTYDTITLDGKQASLTETVKSGLDIINKTDKIQSGGLIRKMSAAFKNYFKAAVEPRSVIRSIEHYDPNGVLTRVFDEITRAETEAGWTEMNMRRDIDEFFNENKGYSKRLTSEKVKCGIYELTVGQAISLYETSKREQARAGLFEAGVTYTDASGKKITARVFQNDIDAMYSSMTDTDKKFTGLVERFFAESSKIKSEADMKINGYTNTIDGFYFPIQRDGMSIYYDVSNTKSIMKSIQCVYNFSFNKNTVEGAKNAIALTNVWETVAKHARLLSIYANMTVPLKTFSRVYSKNTGTSSDVMSIRRTVNEDIWDGADKYFSNLMNDIQGARSNSGKAGEIISKIRSAYAKFQLGANLKVIFSQTASLPTAGTVIDFGSISKGLAMGKPNFAEMDKYCHFAAVRNYVKGIVKAESVSDKISKFGDLTTKPIQWTDRLTIGLIWNACQVQAERNGDGAIGTEENKKAAGKLLEKAGRLTQPNYSATERSALMRSQSEFIKSLTMFTSAPLKQLSRFMDAVGEFKWALKHGNDVQKKSAGKNLTRALAAITAANLMYVMIGLGFKWLYRKKDLEENGFGAVLAGDMASTTIGMMPIVRDIYSFFESGQEISSFAYDMTNDVLGSVAKTVDIVSRTVSGEAVEDYEYGAAVRDGIYAAGEMLGIPTRNINNTFSGLMKRFSPGAAYKYNSLFYGANYTADYKKALAAGDNVLAGEIVDMMMDNRSGKLSDGASATVKRLYEAGYQVLPRAVGKTYSYRYTDENGEQASASGAFTKKTRKQFEDIYFGAADEVNKMTAQSEFSALTEAGKAKAIKNVYDTYYQLAAAHVSGESGGLGKTAKLSRFISAGKAASVIAKISELEADKDKNGKSISGSKKKKVIRYLRSCTSMTDSEKLVMLYALGYNLSDGEWRGLSAEKAKEKVLKYILTYKGAASGEKAEVLSLCGFEVSNGKVRISA